jgi:Na+/melibiose symporter-like transporter
MSAEAEPASPARLRASIVVIASGIFVTGFGWPGLIGRLPFTLLLKNQLGLTAERVAAFWAIATAAYYVKPLVGLICDAYPLFGTRRRAYLLWGSVLSALLWAAFALVPRRYAPFMLLMTALNAAMVFVNTVVGGLQVETAQRHGASGRLASLRSALEGSMYLLGGPLGGWLAARPFGWTAAAGTAILLSFVPIVALLYREPRGARVDTAVFATAKRQLQQLVRSRPMLATSAVMFLFYLSPGFRTPLVYYQQDVLKLPPPFMGLLVTVGGAGYIVGAAIYGVVCRHIPLRISIYAGIVLSGASSLLYLGYTSARAAVGIEAAFGVLATLGALPLYDLVARAAPKGSETFGYGLMISVRNVALYAISDVLGSWLYAGLHLGLRPLVWINALATVAVVFFVPLIPGQLLAGRERKS